ncbi:hypothetical protein [Fusibacter sp. 3D3]|uniref:hypothetical protein n=1 Tax=Fusibacter sp. 3D3 TaxID=1048380 RepID=UPI0008538F41|nr:hypothetical protein [Fusibacter sp. 3D3]GAU77199.1 hypothetical protein F3D3_1813 [Fusibacter sp. 3D3]
MARILKVNQVYNPKNLSVSKIKSTYKPTSITMLRPKAEAHNTPHKSSNNESVLIDYFYEKMHNLKASYQRFSDQNFAKQYYKLHKQEVLLGGQDLVKAINQLLKDSKEMDAIHGTHFHFLVNAHLHDYEKELTYVGIYANDDIVHFDRSRFIEIFCSDVSSLNFLYMPNGFVDQLIKINYKLLGIGKNDEHEGQIIDYHG